MACFVVPTAEAIVTTVVTKVVEKKAKNVEHGIEKVELGNKLSSVRRLNKLLLGGSALLAFEHVWHGEVTPFFPFLTAASNPTDLSEMLVEMGTVGVGMAVLVTAVWATSNIVLKSVSKKVVEE